MKNKIFTVSTFILLIIIISVFFHYSIHIEDALTLEKVNQFGISIPFVRILFEPFIGLLLFFNRVLYTIDEIIYTLHWAILIFLIYSLIKIFLLKNKRKEFIISQILNFPLLIGIWFTLFVIIVFIPLPNNTIVNNSENFVLVTTHSHTNYSHDGLTSQKRLWEWHKRNGFDAFFITDHNNHDRTLDFKKSQRENKIPMEPLVMCGEEFSGSNHMSLLGLKRKFSTKGFADSTVIDSVRANGGAVIVNHWYDGQHKTLEYYKKIGVDGFEIENTATDRYYDRSIYRKVKSFCESNNLIMNGGLDFHGYGNVCSLWNAFYIPDWKNLSPQQKEESILEIIKKHKQDKLKVLMYKDRPFYSSNNLFFSPLFTMVYYFRTLNIYQVLSWVFWIILFLVVQDRIKNIISYNKLFSLIGVLCGTFLLVLGLNYYMQIENIKGFTEMYDEYSTILFYSGSALFLYSIIILWIRNKKRNIKVN